MGRIAGKALGLEEPAFSQHLLLAQAQSDEPQFQSWQDRLQGAVDALKEKKHPLIDRAIDAAVQYGAYQAPTAAALGVNALSGHVSNQIKQEVTPRTQLRQVAAPWAMDYAKHGGHPKKDIDLQVGDFDGQFRPMSKDGPVQNRHNVQSPPNATSLAHELGHSVNYQTPEGKKRIDTEYFRHNTLAGKVNNATKAGGILMNVEANPDGNALPSVLTGAAANLLDGSNLRQMQEEAMAWKRAKGYLDKAGVPMNRALAAKAFATYPAGIAARGAAHGAVGWAYGQALDKGLKGIRDFVVDPLVNLATQGQLSPEEKALEKYGYNRGDHRITADLNGAGWEQGPTWKLEPRFFKKWK